MSYAEKAPLAACRIRDAARPKAGVRDDHLRVISGNEAHRPQCDRLDFPIRATYRNPVPGLVDVLEDGSQPSDNGARVVLERERDNYSGARDQGDHIVLHGLPSFPDHSTIQDDPRPQDFNPSTLQPCP